VLRSNLDLQKCALSPLRIFMAAKYARPSTVSIRAISPRDLYDIAKLYENEGLRDSLFRAFLVYAASSTRPLCELLNPNLSDLKAIYETQFVGMTKETVPLKMLETARLQLIANIQSRLNGDTAAFLRGLQKGEPDFTLIT